MRVGLVVGLLRQRLRGHAYVRHSQVFLDISGESRREFAMGRGTGVSSLADLLLVCP